MTQQQTLETMVGKVTAVNENGLKLEGRGDGWLNFTKLEWRGLFEMPERGDNVKLGMQQDKTGKWWVKTCEIQHKAANNTFEDGQVPAGGRDLSIMRQTAIKAATEVVVALIQRGEYPPPPGSIAAEGATAVVAIDICAVAQDLERWMVRGDIPFS